MIGSHGPAARVRVHPGRLAGTVDVPGDKSISHRALLIGAHADGPVELTGLAPSGDVAATAAALRAMGAIVSLEPAADGRLAGQVTGPLGEPDDVVDCGNSGTALRLLAGVAAGIDGLTVLTGDASLRRRPVARVAKPLVRMGASVDARDDGRLPPVAIRGGRLTGIEHVSPVASAQVKSCVLLAGLAAAGPTTVRSPGPSRDHTERMLAYLGARVTRHIDDDQEVVEIDPGPLTARPLAVPRDPSSAAFWLTAAACGTAPVRARGVCVNPTRTGFLEVLRRMGADVRVHDERVVAGEPVADVEIRPAPLTGAVVDGATVVDAIDELVVLAVAGMASTDGLEIRDAGELRVKESDRIATLALTLRALGVDIEEFDDGYRVPGGQRARAGVVDAHGDHRIAMTAAIAATLGDGPVDITGFEVVATSYPTFLSDLAVLGGNAERIA